MSLVEIEHTELAGMRISRLINGMWQMSGAHGHIDPGAAIQSMLAYHRSGFTTWDLADHYGPSEEFMGRFRHELYTQHGEEALSEVRAFTKWVPRPGPMTRERVERAIDISRRRMAVDTLDMLQFHWWDYDDPRYLDALKHMVDLQQAGKITHLALTNFDTRRMHIILNAGIPIVSNQIQYSLVDRRPEVDMVAFCLEHDIKLLTYGTLGGGLLSKRYLGKPEPAPFQLTTASLRKYKGMVDTWGGWKLLQRLLQVLAEVAEKHNVTIANVATRAILDSPAVGGVIIGVRLGLSDRREENARVFSFELDEEDWQRIDAVQAEARDLYARIGDCGDEYRKRW